MDEKLTNYCFKKFCIVLEEIDGDDVRLILEHEKNGFSIQFKIKVLEIKKLVLDIEIIGNNISNNSLNPDGIIKQLINIPLNQKAGTGYYSNILQFDGLDDELPTLDLAINDAYISIPFVDFNELKKFCDIFKQMVLNIFSQFNIDFNNVENVISNISQVESKLKKSEKITRVYRSAEGELYRIDEEYEKQLQERNQNYKQLVEKKAEFEKQRQDDKFVREKHFEQVLKSVNNFIQKTSAEEFEEYIIKKTSAIPLYDRINKNTIGMDKVMKDILSDTIFADVEDNGISYGHNQMRHYTLTPIQKRYSDIIDDYVGLGRRSKIIHQAQEEAAEIILEQLEPYEKVTKSLIKVLLVKNEFTKSMADLVYLKYQESIK
jgi:hypothetical protein